MDDKESDFLWGVITALLVLHVHGSKVAALDVVKSTGGLEKLKVVANKHGSDAEAELIKWLEIDA